MENRRVHCFNTASNMIVSYRQEWQYLQESIAMKEVLGQDLNVLHTNTSLFSMYIKSQRRCDCYSCWYSNGIQ